MNGQPADIKPYFREDILRHCQSIVFAARISPDPFYWSPRDIGFMDAMESVLKAVGYEVRDVFQQEIKR